MAPKKDAAPAGGAADIGIEEQLYQSQAIRVGLESHASNLQTRILELEKDLTATREAREGTVKDFAVFRDYATVDINRKQAEIDALKQKCKDIEAAKDAAFEAMRADLMAKLEKANQERAAEVAALKAQLAEVTREFNQVKEFLQVQADMEAQIASLTAQLAEQKVKAAEELAEVERKYIVAAEVMRKEQESNWHELKRLARVEAAKNMTEEQKEMLAQNKIMVSELKIHFSETKLLATEKSTLNSAKASLARDIEILRDSEKEWAVRGARQARDLKGTQARLQEVEELLLSERRQHAEDTGALISEFEGEVSEMRTALTTLRDLMELKDRELKTVKRLASVMLQQRTEVEQLLLESMNAVKGEVAARKAERARVEAAAARTVNTVLAERLAPSPIQARTSPSRLFAHAHSSRAKDPHVVGLTTAALTGTGPLPTGVAVTLPGLMEAAPPALQPRMPGMSDSELKGTGRRQGQAHAGGLLSSSAAAGETWPSSGSSSSAPASTSTSVDYSELTAEDRERVLRMLLDKINAKAAGGINAAAALAMAGGGAGTGGGSGGSGSPGGGGHSPLRAGGAAVLGGSGGSWSPQAQAQAQAGARSPGAR